MTTREFLKRLKQETGVTPQLLRTEGDHHIWVLPNWTKTRPGYEHGRPGMFCLSQGSTRLNRAKVESLYKDLGLKSPWHR